MPRKWRNRIITRCSSNVKVAISVSKTLLQLDLVTSIQRVVQCCHLASPNLKNSHVSSSNFHVSICFHSREKIRKPDNLNAPHISAIFHFELVYFMYVTCPANPTLIYVSAGQLQPTRRPHLYIHILKGEGKWESIHWQFLIYKQQVTLKVQLND